MTARATDWGLALLVGLLFATGVMTFFAGQHGDAWVFVAHGVGGFALAGVLGWKLRRVWRRLVRPARWTAAPRRARALTPWSSPRLSPEWAGPAGSGCPQAAATCSAGTSRSGPCSPSRSPCTRSCAPSRSGDATWAGRRHFLTTGALAAGSSLVWGLQRPLSAWVGLRGARRRFTGSYEAGSFDGNGFPSTSWVADAPAAAAN